MKTDEQLDWLFAKNVAAWTPTDGDVEACECWEIISGEHREPRCPRYCTDANAVLPWLEKAGYWKCERHHDGIYVASQADGFLSCSKADTFPRAAVIALLRAKGIEV